MSRIGNRTGFTLIEVMAATMVLVAGVVFIYEAFFVSLDSFGYCSDYLNVASLVNEKVWEIQDDINRYGFLARIDKRGRFAMKNRNFYWSASCNLLAEAPDLDLYKIDFSISWQAGSKKLRLSRVAYATYKYEEE
ncbi:prepilin-type N-terminal cleavage/methylation domain-containing protein [Omnitrophica bacterium]|nr:prepilin-type N-terminal cleavage/methylation domain-containing protein [Candidatus Omnitrophota bacterium]